MKKILCFLLAFLFVLSTVFAIPIFADETVIRENLDSTSVEEDLLSLYPDLNASFPYDSKDDSIYLVHFFEFGYKEVVGWATPMYNLYLYIYNPSRKPLSSDVSKIQFATYWTKDKNGEILANDYQKYDLTKLSSNSSETLVKFKVASPDEFLFYQGTDDSRRYDISGIELSESHYDVKDYKVSTTFTFAGYAKGLSKESKDRSTLVCTCDKLLTLTVEAHQVSHLTGNSTLGAGYSNQVNSVYFAIPNDIEKKYGDLYDIKYEYNHFYTSPIIIANNEASYRKLMLDVGKKVDQSSLPYAIYARDSFQGSAVLYTYSFNYGKQFEDISSWAYYNYDNALIPEYLTSVFYNENYVSKTDYGAHNILVSPEEFESYFKKYNASYHTGKLLGYSLDLFDLEKSNKHQIVTKTVYDKFTLEGYADEHGWFQTWIDYGWNMSDELKDISNVPYIEKVTFADIVGNDNFSKDFLVHDVYADELSDFCSSSKSKNENVYLLRYGIADNYHSEELSSEGIDGDFIKVQANVYLNFDFIHMSFKDKEGEITVIPVVSDPTNGFVNIEDTDPESNIPDKIVEGIDKTMDVLRKFFSGVSSVVDSVVGFFEDNFLFMAIAVGIILLIVFVPWLRDLLKLIGRSISKAFKSLTKKRKYRSKKTYKKYYKGSKYKAKRNKDNAKKRYKK